MAKVVPVFAAGVLALNEKSEVLAVSRQPWLRNKHDYDWGLPAGQGGKDEHPLAVATRQLEAETGLRCYQLVPLITVPAGVVERPFHVYWAGGPLIGRMRHARCAVRWVPVHRFLSAIDPYRSVLDSNRFILHHAFGWNV
jgi:8-oxo-dGTP pyrophosphatase MutT (NUDIX family)